MNSNYDHPMRNALRDDFIEEAPEDPDTALLLTFERPQDVDGGEPREPLKQPCISKVRF